MSDSLDVLVKAVIAKWNATPALVSSAPFFRKEKSTGSESVRTYTIFDDDDSLLIRMSCENEHWKHQLVFRVYGPTPESCAAIANQIHSVFGADNLSLNLAEGSVIKHRTKRIRHRKIDKTVHTNEVTFEFEVSKPR